MDVKAWWRKNADKVLTRPGSGHSAKRRPKQAAHKVRALLQARMQNVDDFTVLHLSMNDEPVEVYFLNTLVDESNIYESILLPLQREDGRRPVRALPLGQLVNPDEEMKITDNLLRGHTILIFPERDEVLQVNTFKAPHRTISPPETESTVLGPQDSFVEMLEVNLSLIRRRIANPDLKIEVHSIGTQSRNKVAILYLEGIANPENITRVQERIKNTEYHGFVGMPILKQMLEDKPYSPFPQFGLTTRPDNAAAALLDGRILLILSGSPEAVICPAAFLELFSSPEDFYNRWSTASLLRMIRFLGLFLTVLLTSSYVSVLTYHPEMLPPPLLTILSESRNRVPFPPVIEVLIIELVIEILREAGIRMPTKIGQMIGIVGGIVIGTASVQAGLASNILIVLVSVSALLSFVPPNFLMSNAIRLVRYGFILSAGFLGMYGQMLMLALMFAHLLNLTSLGTPYMSTGIPRVWSDVFNSLLRTPFKFIAFRSGMANAKKKQIFPIDEE